MAATKYKAPANETQRLLTGGGVDQHVANTVVGNIRNNSASSIFCCTSSLLSKTTVPTN